MDDPEVRAGMLGGYQGFASEGGPDPYRPEARIHELEKLQERPYQARLILCLRNQHMRIDCQTLDERKQGITALGRFYRLLCARPDFFSGLYLEGNVMGSHAVESLCKSGVLETPYIVGLYLRNSEAADAATWFQTMLLQSNTLRELDLRTNDLGLKEITFITEGLKKNSSLHLLNLGGNPLKDVGAKQLSAALRVNSTLGDLRLRATGITNEGAGHLADSITDQSGLAILDLETNEGVDRPTKKAIAAKLQGKRTLQDGCFADAQAGNARNVVRLITHGEVSLWARDDRENTFLHVATQHGDGSLVTQLLELGAGPQAQLVNFDELTPVEVATGGCAGQIRSFCSAAAPAPPTSRFDASSGMDSAGLSLPVGIGSAGQSSSASSATGERTFSAGASSGMHGADLNIGFEGKPAGRRRGSSAGNRWDFRFGPLGKVSVPLWTDSPETNYEKGKGYAADSKYSKAFKRFVRAADRGHTAATVALAEFYQLGKGTPVDHRRALDLLERAADNGSAEGAYQAGLYYLEGRGVTSNPVRAFSYFSKVANQDPNYCSGAPYYVGVSYMEGSGVKRDVVEAVRYLEMAMWNRRGKSLDTHAAKAATKLAHLYSKERDGKITRDVAKALALLKESAEASGVGAGPDSEAAYLLGEAFEKGKLGLEKSSAGALRYYRVAANLGDSDAMYKCGKYLLPPFDAKEAFRWFQRATAKGHLDAQFELGMCHLRGVGTSKKADLALDELTKAAGKGQHHAQLMLGRCHEEGYGIEEDLSEAYHSYKRAADGEVAQAHYHMGHWYESIPRWSDATSLPAWAEPPSDDDAYEAYKKGAKLGDPAAALKCAKYIRDIEEGFEGAEGAKDDPVSRQDYLAIVAKTLEIPHAAEDGETYYRLACYYQQQNGTFPFRDLDEHFYRRAAKLGHIPAMTELAACLKRVESSFWQNDGKEWLAKAAAQQEATSMHAQALSLLGEAAGSPEEAHRLFGDTVKVLEGPLGRGKQTLLARHYLYGLGVPQDLFHANRVLSEEIERTSASNGEALVQLGLLHLYSGRAEKAVQCIKKAEKLGEARACLYLGEVYLAGKGRRQNHLKARTQFLRAYDAQTFGSASRLGYLYQYGLGVDTDKGRAIELYKEAVREGDPLGLINLNWCYRLEPDFLDLHEAEGLEKRILLNFDPEVFMHLAWLCREGICTSQDTPRAITCYQRAEALGVQWAQEVVEEWKASPDPLGLPEPISSSAHSSRAPGMPAEVRPEPAPQEQWPDLDDLLISEIDASSQQWAVYSARAVELEQTVQQLEGHLRQTDKSAKKERARLQQEIQAVNGKLGNIKGYVAKLWEDGRAKREKLEARRRFEDEPNLHLFYRRFQQKVEEVIIGAKSIQGGAAPRKGTTGKVAVAFSFLVEPAEIVPVAGAALSKTIRIGSGVAAMVDYVRQMNRSENISRLATMPEASKEIELAARELTECYSDQIKSLATIGDVERSAAASKQGPFLSKVGQHAEEAASGLAAWALCRLEQSPAESLAEFGALWVCEELTTLDEKLVNADIRDRLNDLPLHRHLVTWVMHRAPTGQAPTASGRIRRLKEELVSTAKEGVEIASKAIGCGVVPTRDGQKWALRDVFTRPGISTIKGLYSGNRSAPHIYGYCTGTEEAVKARGLVHESDWQSSAMGSRTSMSDRSLALQNQCGLDLLRDRLERSERWISVDGEAQIVSLLRANQDLSREVSDLRGEMALMTKALEELRKGKPEKLRKEKKGSVSSKR